MRTRFTELTGVEHPLVAFNRSPAVVVEVSRAGALGVLAATAYTATELDAQLFWIEEQLDGAPYGVDLLVPEAKVEVDRTRLVESLRAQIPQEHLEFVAELMTKYDIPPLPAPSMTATDERPGWVAAWDAMVALVGTDLSDGEVRWGADAVEPGTIPRYLEPIELGCPIHYDPDAARAAGYDDIVAPSTAVLMYTIPPMWSPGDPTLFEAAERDAQPARSPINNADPGPAPRTRGFFATDIELDFLRSVVVGERLGTRGRRLLSCVPKETRVGRGAFCTFESEIVSDRGDVVARMRTGTYAYDPHPVPDPAAEAPA